MGLSGGGLFSRLRAVLSGRGRKSRVDVRVGSHRPAAVRKPPPARPSARPPAGPAPPPPRPVAAPPPTVREDRQPPDTPRKLPIRWEAVDPDLRERLEIRIANLDRFPLHTVRLVSELDNPNVQPGVIAKLAGTEPAMVAEIFRIVNSAFFGFREPVGNLHHAILLLGYNRVKFIAMRLGLDRSVPPTTRAGVRLARVWHHSFLASEALQGLARLGCVNSGETHTAALLHDLGKVLLIDLAIGDGLAQNVEYDSEAVPMEHRVILEDDCFGVDHCVLGARLAERLRLPETVINVQLYHHYPLDLVPTDVIERDELRPIAAVKLASTLARGFTCRRNRAVDPDNATTFATPDLGEYRAVFPRLPDYERLVGAVSPDLSKSLALLATLDGRTPCPS